MNPSAILFKQNNSNNDAAKFMSEININFVANKSKEILSNEYINAPDIDKQSVIRTMQKTIEEKYEDLMYMNRRAVMKIVNAFRVEQKNLQNNIIQSNNYINSSKNYLYDKDNNLLKFDFVFKNTSNYKNGPIRFYSNI